MGVHDPADLTSEVKDLSNFLLEEIRAHHQEDSNGILLANLGWAVINKRPDLKHLLRRYKLGQIIRTNLAGLVEIRPTPGNEAEMRAIPCAKPAAAPAAAITQATSQAPKVIARQYSRAAILAFTRPIQPGHTRIFHRAGGVLFEDVLTETVRNNSSEQTVISPEFILESGPPQSADDQRKFDSCVDAWLQKTGVPIERLLQHKRTVSAKSPAAVSLFDALVAALTEAERRRLQLPVDVILKLQSIQR